MYSDDEFWGALKAVGITPTRKTGPRQWMGINRHREVFPIPDPGGLTPEQRQAAFDLLNDNYGEACH